MEIDLDELNQAVSEEEAASEQPDIQATITPSNLETYEAQEGLIELDMSDPENPNSPPLKGKVSFFDLEDVAKSTVSGVGEAVQSTKDFVEDLGFMILKPIKKAITGKSDAEIEADVQRAKAENFKLPTYESESAIGDFANNAAQYVTGFYTTGAALKGAGVLQNLGTTAKGIVQGAGSSFFAFNEHEKNLVNFINDLSNNPTVLGPLSDWLATDDNDNFLEGRLKNALTDAGFGVAIEKMIPMLKHFKRLPELKKAGDDAVLQDYIKTVNKSSNKQILDELAQPIANIDGPSMKFSMGDLKRFLGEFSKNLASGKDILERSKEAAKWLNLRYLKTSDEAKEVLTTLTEMQLEGYKKLKKVQTHAQLDKRAEVYFKNEVLKEAIDNGVDVNTVMANHLKAGSGNVENAAYAMKAAKALRAGLQESIVGLINKAEKSGLTADELELLRSQLNLIDELNPNIRGVESSLGRGLESIQAETQPFDKKFMDLLEESGGDPTEFMKLFKVARNQHVVDRLMEGVRKYAKKGGDFLSEWWHASVLSSPKTAQAALMGNTVATVESKLVKILGGVATVNKQAIRKGVNELQALNFVMNDFARMNWLQSLGYSKQAFLTEKSVLKSGIAKFERPEKAIPGVVGHGLRIGNKFLTGLDELTTQLNYRAGIYANALEEASAKNLNPEDTAKLIDNAMSLSIEDGVAKKSRFNRGGDVVEQAIESSFQKPMDSEGAVFAVGRFFERIVSAIDSTGVPIGTTVMPFLRAAVNLKQMAYDRIPAIGMIQPHMVKGLMAGGEERAVVIGKQLLGSLYAISLASALDTVTINGAGGQNADLNYKRMQDTNWRPRTIELPNGETIDYSRWGHLTEMLDYFAMFNELQDHLSAGEQQALASALVSDLGEMMTFDNFNSGASELLLGIREAINGETDALSRTGQRLASGFAPLGSLNAYVDQNIDPTMHRSRQLFDRFLDRLWFYNPNLDPVRNSFGEEMYNVGSYSDSKVSPWLSALEMATSTSTYLRKRSPLSKELDTLAEKYRFTLPRIPDTLDDVDLTQFKHKSTGRTAADYFAEAMLDKSIDGKNARESLEDLVSQPFYKEASEGKVMSWKHGNKVYQGVKQSLIAGLYRAHLSMAEAKLRLHADEFIGPGGTLAQELQQSMENQARSQITEQQNQQYGINLKFGNITTK